jgi:Transcription factor WhiB
MRGDIIASVRHDRGSPARSGRLPEVVSADYDPFFADDRDLQAEAIAICATCPVRDACLTFKVSACR